MNILVIEDRMDWRHALVDMYKEIIGKQGVVHEAAGVEDAETQLRHVKYDLLSLDINLGDFENEGGNGMTILEDVANQGLVNGVVLITSAPHDMELEAAVPDEGQRIIARVSLGEYAEKWFSGKNLYYQKPIEGSIQGALDVIKQTLTYERLSELASPPNPFVFDKTSETVSCNGVRYRLTDKAFAVAKEVYDKDGRLHKDKMEYLKTNYPEDETSSKLNDIFKSGAQNYEFAKNHVQRGSGFFALVVSKSSEA